MNSRQLRNKVRSPGNAYLIMQRLIAQATSVEECEELRVEIRGEQEELGVKRRAMLERNAMRKASILYSEGKLYKGAG